MVREHALRPRGFVVSAISFARLTKLLANPTIYLVLRPKSLVPEVAKTAALEIIQAGGVSRNRELTRQ